MTLSLLGKGNSKKIYNFLYSLKLKLSALKKKALGDFFHMKFFKILVKIRKFGSK